MKKSRYKSTVNTLESGSEYSTRGRSIEPYAFVDKKGVKMTKERHSLKHPGQAYCFFHYKGPNNELASELPNARNMAQTPESALVVLTEGLNNLNTSEDPALKGIVKKAKSANMTHVLELRIPGSTNYQAACETGDLINSLYTSLAEPGEGFSGEIVYKMLLMVNMYLEGINNS